MLSIDLFDSRYERKLHEGAVDDAEYARLKKLGEKIDYLKQARTQTNDPEMRRAIDGRIKQYDDERKEILSVRGMKEAEQPTQQPSAQDPFAYVKSEPKGIGDIQDPRTKMASLAQKAKKGPLANVGAGIRGFLTGKDEPLDEQELGRRGIGMTNMKNFEEVIRKGLARWIVQFPSGRLVIGEDDADKLADYYNALDSAGRTNFVYNVLGDGIKFLDVCKKLGIQAVPVEPQQPELPGMPQPSPQQELPLSEIASQKKKSKSADDLSAGDIKVAREIQKLRAQYPAARSDIEAVARAEIDSAERSQRQLTAIRGANEKQDALLKQLVALDREQGQEIDILDQENNSLEQQLAQVQATNDRLEKTVAQMTGTKTSIRSAPERTPTQQTTKVIDIIPGAPADKSPRASVASKPLPSQNQPSPTAKPLDKGIERSVVKPEYVPPEALRRDAANEPQSRARAESQIKEHGGGIGPQQHWQSLMKEQGRPPMDTLNYYFPDINAQSDVEAIRAAIKQIVDNPELSKTSKQRLLGQIGMMVQRNRALIGREWRQYLDRFSENVQETFAMPGTTIPRKSIIQGYTVFFNPETQTVSVTRGGDSEEAAIEQARIGTVNMKNFRHATERLIDKIEGDVVNESIKDTAGATAVIACLLTGGSLTGCATAPQQTSTQQVLKTGQDIGRTVQTAKKITRAGTEAEVNQEIRNLLRGIGSRPEELNNSNILRIWKRIKGQPPVTPEPQAPEYGPAEPVKRPATEAKEINTKDDFIRERDRLLRMINLETDPANKQILKSVIRQLEGRAENEGWIAMQQRMIREDTAALAAEDAILKRIFVKHRDLMMEYGPDKITQAAESVAYNVGDIAHITDEQITEWVGQVESILGARP